MLANTQSIRCAFCLTCQKICRRDSTLRIVRCCLNELAGEKCYKHSKAEIQKAKDKSFEFLRNNHLVMNVQEEYEQFVRFYSELSGFLDLGLTEAERRETAYDRTFNMAN